MHTVFALLCFVMVIHWLIFPYPSGLLHFDCITTTKQSTTKPFIMNSHEVFIHIHQGCFAGTGAIVRLPQCQWSKPGGYGKISQCITIYCSSHCQKYKCPVVKESRSRLLYVSQTPKILLIINYMMIINIMDSRFPRSVFRLKPKTNEFIYLSKGVHLVIVRFPEISMSQHWI